jgi:hypothetical protein
VGHVRLSGNDIILCVLPEPHGARWDICAGNLSTVSGEHLFGEP